MLNEISVEIIRKCPNNCVYCSSFADRHCTEKMPFEKFKDIVQDAVKLGAKTICLSGGEPFLHDSIVDMASFVHACGLNCYIYTSGIVLNTSEQPISLPEHVLESISKYVTKIIFNIEAGSEKTYNKIMGTTKCFDKMKTSAVRASASGICTEAHFVPMRLNREEISSVILLCKEINISKLSFLRLVIHGRAEKNQNFLLLSLEEINLLKEELKKIQERSDFPVRIGVPLSQDVICHKCEAADGKLNIKYDGAVFPCEVFKNHSFSNSLLGLMPDNIYEQSLCEIYDNSPYLACIRKMSKLFQQSQQETETCIGQQLLKLEKSDGR